MNEEYGMELPWIKITQEIQKAVSMLNGLERERLKKFLNHIRENSDSKKASEIFSPEETQSLQKVFKLQSVEDTSLIIGASVHILERMKKFVMHPNVMLESLRSSLGMDTDVSNIFIDAWKTALESTLEDFNLETFSAVNKLEDNKWTLNLAVASHLNKKETLTTALIEMRNTDPLSNSTENTILELGVKEIFTLSQQLDAIQYEVDSILSHCVTNPK